MGAKQKPDFSGWVTKSGIECSDGRTILKDAFKHQDGEKVPLVWQHNHDDPELVLGHVILEHQEEGTYGYGYFNEGAKAKATKIAVEHEDVVGMSIFATQLKEKAKKVAHGAIREVSVVLARANPGAMIENLQLAHSVDGVEVIAVLEDEAKIWHNIEPGEFLHGDDARAPGEGPGETVEHTEEGDGPTAQEVYDSLSEDQATLLHTMVAEAAKKAEGEKTPEPKKPDDTVEHSATTENGTELKHMTRNAFDTSRENERKGQVPNHMLAHDGISERHRLSRDDIQGILKHADEVKSFTVAAEAYCLAHGIESIELLFPDHKALDATPQIDKRRTEWVASWWNGTKKSPFSRVKTLVATITEDEARARGYIKGEYKKGEYLKLAKRITGPKTVYKKQELDRDDILDITDFDIIAWLKIEMRIMLDEEIAVAGLIGDGREEDDPDKIADPAGAPEGFGIRSVVLDHDLYAAKVNINIDDPNSSPEEIVEAVLGAMRLYKGTGSPTFYTTLPTLTMMLLAKDGIGRRLYPTKSDLAAAMMVRDIVDVEPMEREENLVGIIINPSDYTYGADKGGDVTFFSDFKLDYNKEQYLLEARLSGGINKIRSALVINKVGEDDNLVVATVPTFNKDTGVITIPAKTGVTYKREDTGATVAAGAMAALDPTKSRTIFAVANAGYYFANSGDNTWTFRRPAPDPS